MKNPEYNDIKEEIYKCSKCGLCKSVCPVFLATKNETFSPRGRYILLNDFILNNKKLSKSFVKNLDVCLNCNLCKDFCPSGIDSVKIFNCFKEKYNYKYSFLSFYVKYFLYLKVISLFKKNNKIKRINTISNDKNKEKVVYFQGCINKYVNSADKNASLNLLNLMDYEVVKITDICCGLPYLSDLKQDKFEQNAKKIINLIPENIKYIVCSCDLCLETLKKIDKISSKLITIDELLKRKNFKFQFDENVIYFKPLINNKECYLMEGVKEVKIKGFCSLMENFLMLKHPKTSKQMAAFIKQKEIELENKTILTTSNPDCFGIKKQINNSMLKCNIYTLSEYIYMQITRENKS